jgi:hypothetical protein
MKIVVFDLDETLGYFVEFGIFWDSLYLYVNKFLNKQLSQSDFNNILELYPEFLRPNIINILNYLKNRKQSNHCQKLMIYTNNQGSQKWSQHIVSYFETKVNFKLFDQIISAFKINGKQIEFCRTTNNKTYTDFIRCTKIPINSEICYVDDTFYPEMVNDNVYYINIKPYIHDLPFNEIYKRFLENDKNIIKEKQNEFIEFMNKNIQNYNFTVIPKKNEDYEIDKILSKKIMIHLQEFFTPIALDKNNITTNKSRKNRNIRNKTMKR